MVNKLRRLNRFYAIIALTLALLTVSCGSGAPATESSGGTPGSVFISPKTQNAQAGSQIKVSVEVVPAAWGISGAELQVSFDPQKLEAVSIKPGSALGANTIEGMSKIDNAQGTIIYALARQGETTSPGARGVLANIEFRGKSGASGTTKIELTKVGLSDENFQAIAGVTSDGASIVFK